MTEKRSLLPVSGSCSASRKFLVSAAALALAASACSESGSGRRSAPGPARPSTSPSGTPATTEPGKEAAAPAVVWVASEGTNSLVAVRLVPEPAVIDRFAVSGPAHNVTVAPDGTVAATLPARGRLVIVRAGEPSEVELGGSPHDVKPSGDRLVVANQGARRLDVLGVDGTRQGVVGLRANPHDLAVSPDGRSAWVSMEGSADVAVVDLRSKEVSYRPTGVQPHDLLVAPDGRVWVSSWDGALAVLDARGEEVGRVGIGAEAHHLAFTPGGEQVWVTDSPGRRVVVVDARSLAMVETLALEGRPHHVAIAEGRAAVADNTNGSVAVFDVASRRVVATVAVGSGPHGVSASP